MGQKVHPTGFRLGTTTTWQSNWYAKRNYADLLHEDLMIRRYIKGRLYHAGISKVEIERAASRSKINIYTARPGIIIGKRGAEVDKLKNALQDLTKKQVSINI
ncbi:30S ribosomal protein S3, partial [Candidatus Entotheonella serta]